MGNSADTKVLLERIENDFTYHPPDAEKAKTYEKLRASAKELARLMAAICPDSRERSLALTKLEESVMWANASIARGSE